MKLKINSLLALAILSGQCYASKPIDLMKIPASKYDVAELKLQIAAATFDVEYYGDELNEKNLRVTHASPKITRENFVLQVNFRAKSKHITEKKCQKIKEMLSTDLFDLEDENVWYFNSVNDDDDFENKFIYGVNITDEDNFRHRISC